MSDFLAAFPALFIPVCLIAVTQVPLRAGGGLDLSAPGVLAVSTAAGIWGYRASAASVPAAATIMLAAGLLLGLVQGVAVARFRFAPWLVTLLGLAVGTSVTAGPWRNPAGVAPPADLAAISQPVAGWVVLTGLIAAAVWIVQEKFVFGRWLRAAGHHEESARLAGVPVTPLLVAAYSLSGLGAGAAACFLAGRATSPLWPTPVSLLLDILGATLMAAAFPFGHQTRVATLAAAAAVMVALGLALQAVALPIPLILALKAALTLGLAAALPGRQHRWAHRSEPAAE